MKPVQTKYPVLLSPRDKYKLISRLQSHRSTIYSFLQLSIGLYKRYPSKLFLIYHIDSQKLQQYTLNKPTLTHSHQYIVQVITQRLSIYRRQRERQTQVWIRMQLLAVTPTAVQTPSNFEFAIITQASQYMSKGRILSMILSDHNEPQFILKKHHSRDGSEYFIQERLKPIELSPSTDSPLPHAKNLPVYKYIQKRKMVHKPKLRMYQYRHEQKFTGLKSLKRDVNTYLNTEKTIKTKHEIVQWIFDWMMEGASLLKLTKNAYYRSIIVFYQICQKDCRILSSKKLSHLVCGCLLVGAKFQNSSYGDYLRRMFIVNARRVSRQDLILAEHQVLELLQWQVPAHTQIEQQLSQIIRKWNDYIKTVSGEFPQPKHLNKLLINSWDKDNNKLYVEIVYIVDFLVLKNYQQFLNLQNFTLPIILSLYIVTNIKFGDVHMTHHKLWSQFERFLKLYELIHYQEIAKFRNDAQRYFNELKIIQIIGRIPLGLELKKLIKRRDQQFYIQKVEYQP